MPVSYTHLLFERKEQPDSIDHYLKLGNKLLQRVPSNAIAAIGFIQSRAATETNRKNYARALKAVSYTHLDVYKRQARHRTGILLQESTQRQCPRLPAGIARFGHTGSSRTPVSYTHLFHQLSVRNGMVGSSFPPIIVPIWKSWKQ